MLRPKKKKLTIKQICAKPAQYVGQVVTMQGIFLGWGLGESHFPPGAELNSPKTRSDWLFCTGSDCVFVTAGGQQVVSPAKPEDIGCRIEVTGMVALSDDGGVYLDFRKVRRLGSKPVSIIKPAA